MSDNPFKQLDASHLPKDGRDRARRKVREAAKRKAEAAKARRAAAVGSKPPEPLQDDEAQAFARAMSGVAPVAGKGGRQVVPAKETPRERAASHVMEEAADPMAELMDLVSGKVDFTLEHTNEFLQGAVKGLDPKTLHKLRAGAFSPEAHLDLHGMTVEQAFEAMKEFLREHYLRGHRCLLLVTGRGRNSPDGRGVLRDKAQRWLTRDPFKRVVLAFVTALPRHGGPGALYVLIRKYKKSGGKIMWDRTPDDPDLYPDYLD